MAGSTVNVANEEEQIKELSDKLSAKEKELSDKFLQIDELEKTLAESSGKDLKITELGKQISWLEDEVKVVTDRAVVTEVDSGGFKKRVEELETELKAVKPEADVISEYKTSGEYTEAIAEAAADKLLRCWLVAERLIKTDPKASWEKFTQLYVEVEESFDVDGTEPVPYDGPGLIIAHVVQTVKVQPINEGDENQD